LEEENKDNTMPRDEQSQQYNASTPQVRGTRRRKIRDEEEQIIIKISMQMNVCTYCDILI
jgi:hypothetical protein